MIRKSFWLLLFTVITVEITYPAVENRYASILLTVVAFVAVALCVAAIRGIWNVIYDTSRAILSARRR